MKHVLKPIAENTQQHLNVPPVPSTIDKRDEVVKERHKFSTLKMNMTDSKKKLKVKSQLPVIHNSYDLQAIGNYIKWGTFSVDLPFLQASPSKVGAGMSFQLKIDENGNFTNSSNLGVHTNMAGLDNNMVRTATSSTSPSTFPSQVMSTNIGILCHTSNGNINIANQVCAGVGIKPGLLKPLGMSEQQALLCQI